MIMNGDDRKVLGIETPEELKGIQQMVAMLWEQSERREVRDETRRVADESRFAALTLSMARLPDEMRTAVRICRDQRCQEVAAEIAPVAADVRTLMKDREDAHAVVSWWHGRWRIVIGAGMVVVGVATVAYYWIEALAHAVH